MLVDRPSLYIDTNFAQADVFLKNDQPKKAESALNRAIAAMVTNDQPSSFVLAKQVRTSLHLLLRMGQSDRANRLLNVARPFLDKATSLSVPEKVHIQLVLGHLLTERNDVPGALIAYRAGLEALDRLVIAEYMKDWLADQFLINISALCISANDIECAADALARHPLASRDGLIVDGRFRDATTYLYAAAKVIADVLSGSEVDDQWLDALDADAVGVADQGEALRLQSYARLARGIVLGNRERDSIAGKSEVLRAAELRLRWLETESIGHYQPDLFDRLVAQFGLVANAAQKVGQERSFHDDDVALRLIQANNRSLRDIDGDRLWMLSNAQNEINKRQLHSLDRLRSRRMYIESQLLFLQMNRLWEDWPVASGPNRGIDFEALNQFAEMEHKQQQIVVELTRAQPEPSEESLHVNLETLQTYLQDGEVVVSVAAAVNSLVSVCARRDSTLVVANPFDFQEFAANVRAVQQELEFKERSSLKWDSTFAVDEAIEIYDTLFTPLQSCLDGANHIVWIPPAPLGVFPIGALLKESPPRQGDYYDLSAAQWFTKDYAISYATSVRAFIAARAIGASSEADLSFLGIGDPVLSKPLEDGKTGGKVLVAGAVATRSGALDTLKELPETSVELRSIADIEGETATILLRDEATEQNFRDQALGRYKAIAFATHGLIRADGTPNRESALVLTPFDQQRSWDDGLLTAGEIADLNLRAKMVTLSACNAANFDWSIWAGETLGLTTAFATAGVPALMATLWPVESETSTRISTGLYAALALGGADTTPARALQHSINEFLAAPPFATHHHPRYWAPFVMFGDGGTKWNSDTAIDDPPYKRYYLGRFNKGGEFSDIDLSSDGKHAYISGYGDMLNGRFQSLVAKLDENANIKWLSKDAETGSTHIVATDDNSVTLAGFVVESDDSVTVIRKLNTNGDEVWRSKSRVRSYFSLKEKWMGAVNRACNSSRCHRVGNKF
jgi:CHAT domain-containing protein